MALRDTAATPLPEIDAYLTLLKRGDRGRAFLRIMRGFELTRAKQTFLFDGLAERDYPAQVVRGEHDSTLGEQHRLAVQRALGIDQPVLLPAKHFLQEDQAPAVAGAIAAFVSGVTRSATATAASNTTAEAAHSSDSARPATLARTAELPKEEPQW